MKTKLTLLIGLWLVCCLRISAGEVIDGANLFSADIEAVRTAISDLPVTLETRQDIPPGGLKAYADQQVAAVTQRGFYVVISTNPREWRISMSPTTLASPEAVRQVGVRMASRFREGRYRAAAIAAAQELVALSAPSTARPSPPRVNGPRIYVPPAPQHIPATQIYPPPTRAYFPRPQPYFHESALGQIFPYFGFFVLCAGIIVFLAIIGRRNREARARRLFQSYTPRERAEMVRQYSAFPQATDSAITDPLLFWALIDAVESASRPPSNDSSNWTPTDSSFPSSSGFDSSSSSSPPPSSSDSSGAGGSW